MASAGGGAAAGIRTDLGADGAHHWPLGALDIPMAQSVLRWRDRWERPAAKTRWPTPTKHERPASAGSFGAVSRACTPWRHLGGQPSQSGDRGHLGSQEGAIVRVSPAASPRLAKTCPGQAPPATRRASPAGMEKTSRSARRNRFAMARGRPLKWMFQDEARFGRINDGRRGGAPKPIRPLCSAMRTREYTYAYAAVDGWTGEFADSAAGQHAVHATVYPRGGQPPSRQAHPNSTPSNMFGMNCPKCVSTISSSSASMHSKTISKRRSESLNKITPECIPSSHGRGLFIHY